MRDWDINLLREGLRQLQSRLPSGWRVSEPQAAASPIDGTAKLTAPDRRVRRIALQAKRRLDPKSVLQVTESAEAARTTGPLVVVAPYLSEATRTRLRERDVSYLDLTGNARVVVAEPGLYIETLGASQDPDRRERPARSLRGPKAGRIVRALIDHRAPPGVRELATLTGTDAGYVSRVLAFLDAEALIVRSARGRLERVDWQALLRRWAAEAPLETRGVTRTYLEPRGLRSLMGHLANSNFRYAITGSTAAARLSPIAPPRLSTIWVDDAAVAAAQLGLRVADAGANVLLVEAGDESAFEGVVAHEGLCYAAPSLVAADLLTSPGRGPAEGEELLTWMARNEEVWRE